MRNIRNAWIIGVATLLFFVFPSLFFNTPFVLAEENTSVELMNISGPAEVKLCDADDYINAEEGMTLEAGDKIRAAEGASAEISFNENNTNIVRLESGTEAELILKNEEKLEVTKGEVFSSISQLPSDSSFEIRTPTAVTGARGTDWVTKVDEEGTEVEAVEDNPYVKEIRSDGSVAQEATVVQTGYATTVRPFQKPMPLRAISEERRMRWQALKGEVKQRSAQALAKRKERPPFDRGAFVKDLKEKRPEIFKNKGMPGERAPGVLRSGDRVEGTLRSGQEKPGSMLRSGEPRDRRDFEKKLEQVPRKEGRAPAEAARIGQTRDMLKGEERRADKLHLPGEGAVRKPMQQSQPAGKSTPVRQKNFAPTRPRR